MRVMRGVFLVLTLLFIQVGTALAEGQSSLQPVSYNLGEVVVTGTKTSHTLKDVPVDTIVITSEEIARTNAQTVLDVLRQVPGIATSVHDDIFGSYTWRATMRGLNFNDGYGLILVDGHRMVGAGQSGGMGEYGIGLNQIPVSMIERIEVVKGPSSALYGSDAMAGVINIITKGPSRELTASAGVSYGWYDVKSRHKNGETTKPSDKGDYRHLSTAYASFGDSPLENLHFLINYNYEKAEDVRQDPIDSYRHTTLGKIEFEPTDQVEAGLSSLISYYEKEGYRAEDTWRIDAYVNFHPWKGHTLSLKGNLYEWDFEHGYPGYPYGYKHGYQQSHQAELQYSFPIGNNQYLTAGGEYREQVLDYVIENRENLIPVEKNISTRSLYLQDEYAVVDWLTVVPGIRYDDHSVFGEEVNPKLSVMAVLNPKTTVRASVGRAFKSPTIRQLYYQAPYEHGSYFIMSNPDLSPETSVGYSFSIERQCLADALVISVAAFRNDVDDLVQRVDTGRTFEDKPLMTYKNVRKARIQGLEFLAKANIGRFFNISTSYTYTDSEDRDSDRRLTYVPEHAFSLLASFDDPDLGIGASATLEYVGRQYTRTDNSKTITDNAVVGCKIYKDIAKMVRLSFEADNIFGSSKGDEENFRTNRTYVVKMDVNF